MAYTPYYSGGWQSGEQGGTPITPAALNNMENGIMAALTSNDVVNNLSSTETNKALSAAQGKAIGTVLSPVGWSKPLLIRITKQYTNITLNSSGYYLIDTSGNLANETFASLQSLYFVNATIQGFQDGKAYAVVRGATQSNFYLIGEPNATISTIGIQYFYMNTNAELYSI